MKLSVVVCVYNMQREAPRTLLSLSAAYQRGIAADDYEVIVVENGSPKRLDPTKIEELKGNFQYHFLENATPSPAGALNFGIAKARGEVVGCMIDGARICTPGLLHYALAATRMYPRATAATLGYYLGREFQRYAIQNGYNQAGEDALLAQIRWPQDGYRLFEVGALDESSHWQLSPIAESNALFMRKELWGELGGFDEKFDQPGGGLVNLDTLVRATELPDSELVILLGEGTFHQVHGGVATNTPPEINDVNFRRWCDQYEQLRGKPFVPPAKTPKYAGSLPKPSLPHLANELAEPERAMYRRVLYERDAQGATDRLLAKQALAHRDEELASTWREIRKLTARIESLELDRAKLEHEIHVMGKSTSWLLTRPLRTAFRSVEKLKSGIAKLRNGNGR